MTCAKCKAVKNVEENFYTLSLPIPEAEYNYYSIIVMPVYRAHLKKVVVKIHRTGTVVYFLSNLRTITSKLLKTG